MVFVPRIPTSLSISVLLLPPSSLPTHVLKKSGRRLYAKALILLLFSAPSSNLWKNTRNRARPAASACGRSIGKAASDYFELFSNHASERQRRVFVHQRTGRRLQN